MTDFFKGLKPVKFEGPASSNPLAYRFYNKDELVLGKRMEDHIRPAVAYTEQYARYRALYPAIEEARK